MTRNILKVLSEQNFFIPRRHTFRKLMKTSHDYKPAAQLINEWTQKLSDTQGGVDGNDAPAAKSRWTKWKLSDENDVHSVSYCRFEKSESTLLGRLADRLNFWSGNARCAARNKIIEALQQQSIELTEDIKKALPDRFKLGNTNLLESGIKAALKEKAATATREEQLKDYCQPELAEPFGQYLCGVVNKEVTSTGYPLTEKSKLIEQEITDKIAKILEPQLNIFIDSLLISLSQQEKPLSKETIEKFTKTRFKNFLLAAFSSLEAKAIENQISSAHRIVGNEVRVQNGLLKRTDTLPQLNPTISVKLIESAIKQRTENIFEQRALGDSLPILEKMSDTLGTHECTRVFSVISETLTLLLEQIENIGAGNKIY
jgi:hypothetical protein